MAGGPFLPSSAFPVTAGKVFPYVYVGAGANSKYEEGLGVMASLDADAIWDLRFQMPTTLPTGTPTFRLLALANATAGVARVNPKLVSVAVGESPSAATPVAETVTPDSQAGQSGGSGATLTWGNSPSDADQYLEARWTITVVAGGIVVCRLTFETSSWTLATISVWFPSILFV
jgi:hypothetical protein